MRRYALWALLLLAATPARAGRTAAAREQVVKGDFTRATVLYSRERLTRKPERAAEYAYALAAAGYGDLALGHLDHALALQEKNPSKSAEVNYLASEVFRIGGQSDIAAELALEGSRPAWLPDGFSPPAAAKEVRGLPGFDEETAIANSLLLQNRYYTAAARYQRIVEVYPNEPLGYAGFAVALEKIGAYRKAARAVARSLELQKGKLSPEEEQIYELHRQELEQRTQEPPPVERWPRRANLALKGRYLAFVGGNLHRSSQNTVSSLDARLGKFFTNRVEGSVTAGYTGGNIPKDYRGASFGLAGRYHQPLPVPAPVNATLGTRLEYLPRPSAKTSVVLSPGLSWVRESGSFDIFYEYGVSGPLKKTKTVSVGYTVYFKARK